MAEQSSQIMSPTDEVLAIMSQALLNARNSLAEALVCIESAYPDDKESGRDHNQLKVIRAEVAKSVLLYQELHLPQTKKVVTDLKEIFSFYHTLDDQTFQDSIQVIAEVVAERSENAKLVTQLNVLLLEQLKCHKRESSVVLKELTMEHEAKVREEIEVAREFKLTKEYHEDRAETWADFRKSSIKVGAVLSALTLGAALPFMVAAHVGGNIKIQSHEKRAQATEKDGNLQTQRLHDEGELAMTAATTIEKQLITALTKFTASISEVAGFFNVLKSDVDRFASLASNSMKPGRMALYLKNMQKCGKDIIDACNDYLRYEPDAEAQIGTIRFLDKDLHYGQEEALEWLKQARVQFAGSLIGN